MQSLGAPIVSLEDFSALRPSLERVVVVSGGYDPLHPGHISNFLEAKRLGATLAVVVNGDAFLMAKKGRHFQDLKTRCLIISALHMVDYVIPFEIEEDMTVCVPLEVIRPDVFANGGDRKDAASIPEWHVCQRLGIEMVFGVGVGKVVGEGWSSSWLLKDWEDFKKI